jgi:hypothetical protein
MPNGYAGAVGIVNSVITPDVVLRPILLQPGSQTQRFPSGPLVMRLGEQFVVGSLNSVNTRHAVAAALQPFVHPASEVGWHLPALQVPEQGAVPQATVGKTQAPSERPPQVPPQTVPAPLHAGWLAGGGPEATGLQVPARPGRLQARQDPVHAWSQHTPSAHVEPARQPPAVAVQVCPRLLLHAPVASQVPAQRPFGSSLFTAATQAWFAEHVMHGPAQSAS